MAAGNSAESETRVVGRPWQTGQSGNPAGRAPLPPELKLRLAELGPEAIERLAEIMHSNKAGVAVRACEAILDRWLGKAPQALIHEGGDGAGAFLVVRLEGGDVIELPALPEGELPNE